MKRQNRQWVLIKEPFGLPQRSDFELRTAPALPPGPSQVLLKLHYISLDPGLRFFMRASLHTEGSQFVPLGAVMRAWAVGEVVESNTPRFPVGSYARDNQGWAGIQDYSCICDSDLTPVDIEVASLPTHLSALGMTGLTAYFGMMDIGQPKAGQTVVVSGAAGAVGSVAGQIAKIHGCRVIGIAGGRAKCDYLTDLGFDASIDYKSENLLRRLRELCPSGIDICFDNVGGEILDDCLELLARRARVVFCGNISTYNEQGPPNGLKNYFSIILNEARMEGYHVMSPWFVERYPQAIEQLGGWLRAGRLSSREDIVAGLENFPEALVRLFKGDNFGKLVLEV